MTDIFFPEGSEPMVTVHLSGCGCCNYPFRVKTELESTKRFPGEFPLYQTYSSCPYHVAATLLFYNNLSQLQFGNSFPWLLLCQHEKPKMSSSHRFRLNGILLVLSCEKFPPLETRTTRSTKSKLKEQEAQILQVCC